MKGINLLLFAVVVVTVGALVVNRIHRRRVAGRTATVGAALAAGFVLVAGVALLGNGVAHSAIVPTVPLGTAAAYSVLGASTVTNTGNSTLAQSLGLWPGTSVTGFPPGLVNVPGVTDVTNAAAQLAQGNLTTAYDDAAGRSVDAETTADLGNLLLQAGVYSGPSKGALGLTGTLTLDGNGNLDAVFIFQTDSSLTTASSSTVTLINGAQECNVFWVVGSSATLGQDSVMVGNILALTSITVNNSVTVHGRALAREGAVTLDDDTFVAPTCDQVTPPVETTLPGGVTTAPVSETTAPLSETTAPVSETTAPVSETTAPVAETTSPVSETTAPVAETTVPPIETTSPGVETTSPLVETTAAAGVTTMPGNVTTSPRSSSSVALPDLPNTGGGMTRDGLVLAMIALTLGGIAVVVVRTNQEPQV